MVPALQNLQREARRVSAEKLAVQVRTAITFADLLPGHPGGHASCYLEFAHTVLSLT